MVAGYILYRVKQPPKIPLIVNMGLWLVSLFTLVIVIFGVGGGQLSRIATSFYVSLGHTGNHDTFLFAFLLYILFPSTRVCRFRKLYCACMSLFRNINCSI